MAVSRSSTLGMSPSWSLSASRRSKTVSASWSVPSTSQSKRSASTSLTWTHSGTVSPSSSLHSATRTVGSQSVSRSPTWSISPTLTASRQLPDPVMPQPDAAATVALVLSSSLGAGALSRAQGFALMARVCATPDNAPHATPHDDDVPDQLPFPASVIPGVGLGSDRKRFHRAAAITGALVAVIVIPLVSAMLVTLLVAAIWTAIAKKHRKVHGAASPTMRSTLVETLSRTRVPILPFVAGLGTLLEGVVAAATALTVEAPGGMDWAIAVSAVGVLPLGIMAFFMAVVSRRQVVYGLSPEPTTMRGRLQQWLRGSAAWNLPPSRCEQDHAPPGKRPKTAIELTQNFFAPILRKYRGTVECAWTADGKQLMLETSTGGARCGDPFTRLAPYYLTVDVLLTVAAAIARGAQGIAHPAARCLPTTIALASASSVAFLALLLLRPLASVPKMCVMLGSSATTVVGAWLLVVGVMKRDLALLSASMQTATIGLYWGYVAVSMTILGYVLDVTAKRLKEAKREEGDGADHNGADNHNVSFADSATTAAAPLLHVDDDVDDHAQAQSEGDKCNGATSHNGEPRKREHNSEYWDIKHETEIRQPVRAREQQRLFDELNELLSGEAFGRDSGDPTSLTRPAVYDGDAAVDRVPLAMDEAGEPELRTSDLAAAVSPPRTRPWSRPQQLTGEQDPFAKLQALGVHL